ncbi:MAG: hypothetical protein ACKOBO_01925 [Acidimicrobiales bacterium]
MRNRPSRPVGAIGLVFFANGASFANWLPRIDEVRDAIGVGNRGLGIALLGGGLGGILGSLLAARVLRPGAVLDVLRRSAVALALAFPLIAVVPGVPALLVLLTFLGLADVLCDTAMNAEAAAVQATTESSIMQRIHGMWSVGFVAGSIVGWVASVVGVPLALHLVGVSLVLLTVSVRSVAALASTVAHAPAGDTSTPASGCAAGWRFTPALAAVPLLALGAAALESTPNDWSAVALRDALDAGRLKGAGPVVFAAAMLVGRFRGDRMIDALGATRVMLASLVSVGAGVATIVMAPHAVVALCGFALWGLGVSVMFPQVYLMAANANSDRPGAGLAAMTLAQRGGFMATTASMGVLSASGNFDAAFTTVFTVAAVLWLAGLTWSHGAGTNGREAAAT